MNKPTIVCLCGSTRFYKAFQEANYRETMAGKIVLSVGFYPHAEAEAHGEEHGCTPEQKIALDALHKRKIDMSDEILVLNVGGYIGESTRAEILYALVHDKDIRYLEPPKRAKGKLAYDDLKSLWSALVVGEFEITDFTITVDNDGVWADIGDHRLAHWDPRELLHQALDLLGLPHEDV